MGRVKVGAVVIVLIVALITVLAVILVRWSIGGIFSVIFVPVLSLEERAPVSVSDVGATLLMVFCGRGRGVKLWQFILRQVVRPMKKYDPWALPVALRSMAPVVRSCIVLSWDSWTCAYLPNWSWQWFM